MNLPPATVFIELRTRFAVLLGITVAATLIAAHADTQMQAAGTARAEARRWREERAKGLGQEVSSNKDSVAQATLYEAMRSRGMTGDERREEWIERLEEIRRNGLALGLRYEILQPRPLAGSVADGPFFRGSRMHLQMRVLHEGDLLAALNQLRARAPALLQVRGCELTRLDTGNAAGGTESGIDADCQLDWITLAIPGEATR